MEFKIYGFNRPEVADYIRKGLLLFILFILMSCQYESKEKLTVASAANMQFAIEELAQKFTEITGVECELVLGSSGKLLAQIVEGAPYDVFVSADTRYPEVLYNRGMAIDIPEVYAFGKLVLWTGDSIWHEVDKVNFSDVKKFAMANPKTAPYGVAALQVLQYYDWEKLLAKKLVYGESIAQTNLFLTSKSAEMGLTSQSILYSERISDRIHFMHVDQKSYSPLAQSAVLIQESSDAEQFYDFLFSSDARVILQKFGYLVPESK